MRGSLPWRLSIEDPFELHDSAAPHDLGIVLSKVRVGSHRGTHRPSVIMMQLSPHPSDQTSMPVSVAMVYHVQAGQEKLCARFAEAAAALTTAGKEIETWQRLFPFVPLIAVKRAVRV